MKGVTRTELMDSKDICSVLPWWGPLVSHVEKSLLADKTKSKLQANIPHTLAPLRPVLQTWGIMHCCLSDSIDPHRSILHNNVYIRDKRVVLNQNELLFLELDYVWT